MMVCGIAHFGQRGLDKIWSNIFSAQGIWTPGVNDNPLRRESKPLVTPRVQTQGNKKLDQIFQFRSKQRKKIIVNFPFQTHFTKIQNRKYKNTKNTNTSNIDIDLTCPHEGPLCLCAGLHLRKPHTATQNMTQ